MGRSWTVATMVATTLAATILSAADNAVEAKTSTPKECPKRNPPHETIHLPHEWDCTKFYTCDHGRRVLFECPVMDAEGNRLYYNPELEVCDWPEHSGCVQGIQPTTAAKTTEGKSLATTQSTTQRSPTWSEIITTTKSSPTSTEATTTRATTQRPTTTSSPTTIETSTQSTTTPTTIETTVVHTTERPTTTLSPTTVEISTQATTTPTTIKTTIAHTTTERPTTTLSPTTVETSTQAPTKPTTIEETRCPTTELISTTMKTSTEVTNAPTTIETTSLSTSTELPSTTRSKPTTIDTTANTTPSPTDNIEKPSTPTPTAIYIPHENNCSLFYKVVNNETTLEECPPGLHFSPILLTCMSPADAGCESTTVSPEITTPSNPTCGIPCDGISHGSLVSHECLCDKYYRCSNGDLILHRCPKGLHFNPTIYSCDYPSSAGCITTTPKPSTDKPTTSMTIPSQCPPENSGGTVQFPHPTNCSLFYKCDNGEKKLMQCPEGLHFNPNIQMCDWPNNAGCIATTNPVYSSEATTEATAIDLETSTKAHSISTTTVSTTTKIIPTECPTEDSGLVVQLPHPYNCSLYYKCKDGKKILQSCPPGLEFNPREQVCDWPDMAGCVVSTTETPLTTVKFTTEKMKPSTETTISPNTTIQVSTTIGIPTECPANDSGRPVHLPHPHNCSLYYNCENGRKIIQSCPPGLEFNPREQICDWPDVAGCIVSTTETPLTTVKLTTESIQPSTEATISPNTTIQVSTTIGIPTECPANDSSRPVHLPHPYNCSLYYNCENGKKIIQSCPPGLEFNPREQICDWPEVAGCVVSTTETPLTTVKLTTESIQPSTEATISPNTTIQVSTTIGIPTECPANDSSRPVHLPHPYNCSLYYNCENGKKIIQSCPPGLEFNPREQICDWPEVAGCIVSTTETPLTTIKLTTESIKPSTEATISPNTTIQVPTTIGIPTECPANDSGRPVHLPHPYNCSLYYNCENGKKIIQSCPPGLEFNPREQICDWPDVAGCIVSTTETPLTTLKSTAESIKPSTEATISPNTTIQVLTTIGIPTECPANDSGRPVHLPHPHDCSLYYICENGEKFTQSCPPGLEFNAREQVCDWPDVAGCIVSTTEKPLTTVKLTTESLKTSTETTISPNTTTQVSTTIGIPTECPADDSGKPVHLPHPYNCSLYYNCESGKKTVQLCPPGLEFNARKQVCDWPDVAGCIVSTTEKPLTTVKLTTESMKTSTETTISPNTTSQVSTTIGIPTECPADDSGKPVHLPHPYNCSLYYNCENGKKILQLCPPGLEFNPREQVCDWPDIAGCIVSTTETPLTTGKLTTESIKTSTETTISPNTTTQVSTTIGIPTECSADDSGKPVYLPHPYNCSLYYNCESGKKIVQLCPPGLEFNAREQVCDWPDIAGCIVSTTETPLTTSKLTTESIKPSTVTTKLPDETTTEEITTLPTNVDSWTTHPESTESSIASSTAITETRSPKTTIEWITSSETSTTDSTNPEITDSSSECPPGSNGSQLPHESNCSLYYECNDGKKVLMECTPGLHFSPVLELCVWPSHAGCEATTISTDSSPSLITEDNVDQESWPSPTTIYSSTPDSFETEDPDSSDCIGTCPAKDPSDHTVLLPHKDCTKFCKCSNSRPFVYACPAGLHFSPTLFVCDYPKKAKCLGEGGSERPQEISNVQYV